MAEEALFINGGIKLSGEIEVMGSKNAAFGVFVSALLTDDDCLMIIFL
jgi:UDP-N-acetylglucosamine enolpyruvyl transferase